MKKLKHLGDLGVVLTRSQLSKIVGGSGTCAVKGEDNSTIHGYSYAEAYAYASQNHTNWCCDSCSSTSWYCPTGEYC